ncbi:MAG: acetyl-CoA carboxylase carboxyltransferase subunit alpha [Deltaproteobacteria bacterium]|nr:acetyl-CoA carboxylase carboxyltransferase subunit alpha [Deltaproteobacteria bacterium]
MALATLPFEKPVAELDHRIAELRRMGGPRLENQIRALEDKAEALRDHIFSRLTRWQMVQLSRHPRRPYSLDYISRIFTDFQEFHGDRRFADDESIVAGFARLDDVRVMVIGQQKGRGTKENLRRNFGMPRPEGYRKALRLMKLAERFDRPIITFIDTPGAYPGIGAEERGQSQAIAENLEEMMKLRVPVISTVIGEGGSGGALALGVTDRINMLRYTTYSVITPEGCASILWRDAANADKAAEAMRLTAPDLVKLGIIDEVIDEARGGAHRDPGLTAANVERVINRQLDQLLSMDAETRIADRRAKYRAMGVALEPTREPEERARARTRRRTR